MSDSAPDITRYGNKSYVRAVHGTQFDEMPEYVDFMRQKEGWQTNVKNSPKTLPTY